MPESEEFEMSIKPILVGVDELGTSLPAVEVAVREGALRNLPVELVHSTRFYYLPSHDNEAPLRAPLPPDEYARQALHEAELTAARIDPNVPIAVSAHEGDPIEYFVERSHDAALIVLGTHRIPSLWGAVVRSVGQSVAAHARCPVMLVNHEASPPQDVHHEILVGVSPSDGGRQALRFAFEEARARQCELVAIRCASLIIWASATPAGYGSYLYDDWEKSEQAILDQELACFSDEFPDVKVVKRVLNQAAVEGLEAASTQAELLVVGAHRRDGHWHSRLGPVAGWLLHHAYCPVAVVGRAAPVLAAAGTD